MTTQRHPGCLLKEADLSKEEFLRLVADAGSLKAAKRAGTESKLLAGSSIALVFQRASTRTRCAFEVAAHDQRAHVIYLGPQGSHNGAEEPVEVSGRLLLGSVSQHCAEYAPCPVVIVPPDDRDTATTSR